MNQNHRHWTAALAAAFVLAPALAQSPAGGSPPRSRTSAAPPAPPAIKPCSTVTVDPPTQLTLGKSQVIRLSQPAARIIVGGQASSRAGRPLGAAPPPGAPAGAVPPGAPPAPPSTGDADGVADTEITLLSPTELFFLGRKTGSMNVVLQSADGRCVVKDIVVTVDPATLQATLGDLLPDEREIKVKGAGNSLVLTGNVSDSVKLAQIMTVAATYADTKKIVNLMRVTAPQQVMLEVKIAEVSKSLLDHFGLDFSRIVTSADGLRTSIISGIVGGTAGLLGRFEPNVAGGGISGNAASAISGANSSAVSSVGTTTRGSSLLGINAKKQDGVIRVLAEPNIMAISGQVASFLSGGKIFIPVAQSQLGGGNTITLEEKEFGVGLKFTPTVLDGRINLKVVSEVSELSQTGTPFTTVGGVTAVLPSMSTRRVDTTVQLGDGQSFAVAGLIKNNFTEAMDKFPGLGEVPVMGALFRSTEFQNDQTELMFVVTPRLVKPMTLPVTLPTDNHITPSRADVHLMGSGEGSAPPPAPMAPAAPAMAPAPAAPGMTRP